MFRNSSNKKMPQHVQLDEQTSTQVYACLQKTSTNNNGMIKNKFVHQSKMTLSPTSVRLEAFLNKLHKLPTLKVSPLC